jgi:hypothetical protein
MRERDADNIGAPRAHARELRVPRGSTRLRWLVASGRFRCRQWALGTTPAAGCTHRVGTCGQTQRGGSDR